MTIPQATLDEIRERTDIVELISSYGIAVRRAGADYKACCPFHHEKTPSFSIRQSVGRYHCFGCGADGDAFRFVMQQEGLGFMDAVRKLAEAAGVKLETTEDPNAGKRSRLYELHAALAAFFRRCLLQTKEAAPAREYLAKRAIPSEFAEKFMIGYVPRDATVLLTWAQKYNFTPQDLATAGVLLPPKYIGGNYFNRFGGRLVFVICDRSGRPVAFSARILTNDKTVAKYVNSPETDIFKKSNVLYALHHASPNIVRAPHREAIICEGQIDVLRCHSCGFNTAVASQGTAFTAEHVKILKRCADSVVLVFDDDAAGHKAAIRTGGLFLAAEMPVRVATLPDGHDPDSMLRDVGAEAFRECLNNAESITSFEVRSLRAAEENPDSIDAVRRVMRTVLETLSQCPSAVMRASLMKEAAALMGVPVSALESDYERMKEEAASHANFKPTPPPPSPDNEEPPNEMEGEETAQHTSFDEQIIAPPHMELSFCAFLAQHERENCLAEMLAAYAPPELYSHNFTRAFVAAWQRDAADMDAHEVENFDSVCSAAERVWLSELMMAEDKTADSLRPIGLICREQFLRPLWVAALERERNMLNVNDVNALTLALRINAVRTKPWHQIAQDLKLNVFGS